MHSTSLGGGAIGELSGFIESGGQVQLGLRVAGARDPPATPRQLIWGDANGAGTRGDVALLLARGVLFGLVFDGESQVRLSWGLSFELLRD